MDKPKEKWEIILSWVFDFIKWYVILYLAIFFLFLIGLPFLWSVLKIFPQWFSKTSIGIFFLILVPISLYATYYAKQESNKVKVIAVALVIIFFVAFFMYTGMPKYHYKYHGSGYSDNE